jgi:hypothetical protein
MVHNHHGVCGKVDVKLAAPETALLGRLQGGNGILGITGLLALPVTAMGTYFLGFHGRCRQRQKRKKQNKFFHSVKLLIFLYL